MKLQVKYLGFHIINFLFLSSNIPSGPSYGIYISQLIRYARRCTYYDHFGYRHKLLVDKLLSQGYEVNRLRNSFQKFYGRYPDVVAKYQKSVRDMINDSFPFLIQWTCAVKVLSIFLIYRICLLEYHFNTIVPVCDGCHARGRQRLLNLEHLVVLSTCPIFMLVYSGKHSFWICHLLIYY